MKRGYKNLKICDGKHAFCSNKYSQKYFPCVPKKFRVTTKFPVFSLSGKSKNQILRFSCAAAILIWTFKIGMAVFQLTSSVATRFLLTLSASDSCLFMALFSRSKFSILLSYLVFISKSLLSKLFLKRKQTNENEALQDCRSKCRRLLGAVFRHSSIKRTTLRGKVQKLASAALYSLQNVHWTFA